MWNHWTWSVAVAAMLAVGAPLSAQEVQQSQAEPAGGILERANQTVDEAQRKLDDVAQQVNQSEDAELVRAGILAPIYKLAEQFSFSSFHWLAFAVMVTGVVSFALQLTLGKLVVFARRGVSLMEILTDMLGLVVSLVGLVLTTQAAAQNSSFTSSAFAVLTSAGVGALLGIIFYWWGQRQELLAMSSGKRASAPAPQTRS